MVVAPFGRGVGFLCYPGLTSGAILLRSFGAGSWRAARVTPWTTLETARCQPLRGRRFLVSKNPDPQSQTARFRMGHAFAFVMLSGNAWVLRRECCACSRRTPLPQDDKAGGAPGSKVVTIFLCSPERSAGFATANPARSRRIPTCGTNAGRDPLRPRSGQAFDSAAHPPSANELLRSG